MATMAVRAVAVVLAGAVGLLLTGALYFSVGALARERPEVRQSTAHSSLSRESCIECHAPIAAEWRESFHFRSVTGPFWERIRTICVSCHVSERGIEAF